MKLRYFLFLMIIIFCIGCAKQEADTGKPGTENEDTMIETIADTHSIPITQVEIVKVVDPPIYNRTFYVDQDISMLEFFKFTAISIEGLGKLSQLETIKFVNSLAIEDFSFLSEIPNLKRLFIIGLLNIDWNFLENLPNLEVLHIERYLFQPEITIDLKNNIHLEYIGFTGGFLETFPVLVNMPETLKYINLEINKIGLLPQNVGDYNVTIFMNYNSLEINDSLPDNVTFNSADEALEDKYHVPYYPKITVSLSDVQD